LVTEQEEERGGVDGGPGGWYVIGKKRKQRGGGRRREDGRLGLRAVVYLVIEAEARSLRALKTKGGRDI
jgi:hypothetical protein